MIGNCLTCLEPAKRVGRIEPRVKRGRQAERNPGYWYHHFSKPMKWAADFSMTPDSSAQAIAHFVGLPILVELDPGLRSAWRPRSTPGSILSPALQAHRRICLRNPKICQIDFKGLFCVTSVKQKERVSLEKMNCQRQCPKLFSSYFLLSTFYFQLFFNKASFMRIHVDSDPCMRLNHVIVFKNFNDSSLSDCKVLICQYFSTAILYT